MDIVLISIHYLLKQLIAVIGDMFVYVVYKFDEGQVWEFDDIHEKGQPKL